MKNQATLSSEKQRMLKMLKALGNPIRLQIVEFLAERQMCITGEIVENTPLAQSTVSQHLKVLREAGLVRGEVEGPATNYCLDQEGFRFIKKQLTSWLAEHDLDGQPLIQL
jgi:ArsR family transcriptional regulator, arsenate/arsenite/antimonite-responsive transcriptional repressor